jgi:hypothetical protein
MSLPPDEPTRPLRPIPITEEDLAFREEVMDRLGSLRTWVAVATILSLLALGLAAFAYITAEDDDGNRNRGDGVRASQVQVLEDRLDELEAEPDAKGVSNADFNALAEDQAALSDQVEQLSAQVEEVAAQADTDTAPATAEDAEAREAIETLDQTVADLDARVQALEQAAP